MKNLLDLQRGRQYIVVKSFTDFDRIEHPEGETWIYQGTNFLPYEDGLTLHALQNDVPVVYRLQWRGEEQAEIIEHFRDYVRIVE